MAGPYPLRADTIVEVPIGPAIAVGDGFTPVTTLTIAAADEAELIKHGATTSAGLAGTLAVYTAVVDGYYHLDLSASETDTEGQLTIVIQDDSLILPIRNDFVVLNQNAYDALYAVAGTDKLEVDVVEQVGTTVPTPGVTGVPDVNVTHFVDELAPAPIITGVPDVNSVRILDVAPTLTNNDLDVNIAQIIGTAPTLTSTNIDVNVETMTMNTITAAVIATNAIDADSLATDFVDEIRDGLLPTQNLAFNDIPFLFVAASDHVTPVTAASTITITRSLDGAAFGAISGTTVNEIGNGMYHIDASAADMNAGKIIFRIVATGGTPGAPDDAFVSIITGGGV